MWEWRWLPATRTLTRLRPTGNPAAAAAVCGPITALRLGMLTLPYLLLFVLRAARLQPGWVAIPEFKQCTLLLETRAWSKLWDVMIPSAVAGCGLPRSGEDRGGCEWPFDGHGGLDGGFVDGVELHVASCSAILLPRMLGAMAWGWPPEAERDSPCPVRGSGPCEGIKFCAKAEACEGEYPGGGTSLPVPAEPCMPVAAAVAATGGSTNVDGNRGAAAQYALGGRKGL